MNQKPLMSTIATYFVVLALLVYFRRALVTVTVQLLLNFSKVARLARFKPRAAWCIFGPDWTAKLFTNWVPWHQAIFGWQVLSFSQTPFTHKKTITNWTEVILLGKWLLKPPCCNMAPHSGPMSVMSTFPFTGLCCPPSPDPCGYKSCLLSLLYEANI